MLKCAECIVLVPANDRIESETEDGLRELEQRGFVVNRAFGHSAIDVARNLMAYEALAKGFKGLIWIDSDMFFQPDDVDKLRTSGHKIISGLYIGRNAAQWTAQFLDERSVEIGTNEIREIKFAAGGFIFVHRDVYEVITRVFSLPICGEHFNQPLRPWYWPIVTKDVQGHWCYFGEDYSFCYRARQCGFRVMADLSIKLGHIGRAIHAPVEL